MFCYNCGCRLSEHNFCTACGADVGLYKRIIAVSNKYYNDGLAKASVRDLTGAVTSLRQSLKFDKNNIDARNLLGLVYFEMGEVVAALSEWVISKNLRPEKNIADDYISVIQASATRLDTINQTIKKYNQALMYCMQDSKDLAIIQLRKVLSLNPKFIRAHQLLALLYIDAEQWDRAKRELVRCAEIDRNNTLTLSYMKEVDKVLAQDEMVKPSKKKGGEPIRYQSDNEIIIQPMNVAEPKRSGTSTLVNIFIGIVIGIAAMYLVIPSVKSNANNEAQKKISEIGNQIDAKNNTITELENRIKELQGANDTMRTELDGYVGANGTLEAMEQLINVASLYFKTDDVELIARQLDNIAEMVVLEETMEAFQGLYRAIFEAISPRMSLIAYEQGYQLYQSEKIEEAIPYLEQAVKYDPNHGYAVYYLAQSYRRVGENEKAIAMYERVLEVVPGTERATRAERYIIDLKAAE